MSSDFEPESRWPNLQLSHRVSRLFRSLRRDAEPSVDYSYYELSGIDEQDNAEFPTGEERESLRRVADAIPWNAFCESRYHILRVQSFDSSHPSDSLC